jgi:hypothetical protein
MLMTPFKKALFKNRTRGASLVSVLVGVGITGIVATVMAQLAKNGFNAQGKITLDADKTAVEQFLMTATSCADTLPTATCTAGDLIDIKRRNAKGVVTTIVSSVTPTMFGRWTVRAICNATGDGINVEAVRVKAGTTLTSTTASDFLADPLTHKVVQWGTAQASLIPTGVSLCSTLPLPANIGTISSTTATMPTFSAGWAPVPVGNGTNMTLPLTVGSTADMFFITGHGRFMGSGAGESIGMQIFKGSTQVFYAHWVARTGSAASSGTGCPTNTATCTQLMGGGSSMVTNLAPGNYTVSLMSYDVYAGKRNFLYDRELTITRLR